MNCLTEIFVDRALQRAQELDNNLSTTGKVIGPLHGLPISLKDQINISGLESTMGKYKIHHYTVKIIYHHTGYISWVGVYPENNATLVDTLVSLGAVPFVKTNVPQTLMVICLLLFQALRINKSCSGEKHSIISLDAPATPTTKV